MIPFDRSSFEIVSMIEFANFTENEYCVISMQHNKDGSAYIEMFRKQKTFYKQSNDNYWFLIEFGVNFN